MLWTLVLSSSHLEGSWQKEVLLDPSGQSMEQILGNKEWIAVRTQGNESR